MHLSNVQHLCPDPAEDVLAHADQLPHAQQTLQTPYQTTYVEPLRIIPHMSIYSLWQAHVPDNKRHVAVPANTVAGQADLTGLL